MNVKLLLSVFLLSMMSLCVVAQKDKNHQVHHIELSRPSQTGIVKIGNISAPLMVESYSGNRIEIEAFDVRPMPERAKGLRPLGVAGVDNTGIGLSIQETNNVIEIGETRRGASKYIVRIPQDFSLNIDYQTHFGSEIEVRDIDQEIEINAMNSGMKLINVTGPAVLHSVGGLIEVSFSKVNQDSPISITSTGGEIDISIPSSTKASFDLTTMGGDIYTDLDLRTKGEDGNLQRLGGQNFEGTLNGGGVKFSVNSVGGTIYLRDKSNKSLE